MERPRYLYRAASSRQRYPCWPVWYRERHPIKKHFRVLDCEDVYDSDDFYKIELNVRSDPAYTQYVSPSEFQRFQYQKRARLRAEAIVREIETYKHNAVWRKRLTRASREFEFVFEPYDQALRKQHGLNWRWVLAIKREQKRQQVYAEVWQTMTKLAWKAQHPTGSAGKFVKRKFIVPEDLPPELYDELKAKHWYNDKAYIDHTFALIKSFNSAVLLRTCAKLIGEMPTIQDQIRLCEKIQRRAADGTMQQIIDYLVRWEQQENNAA